MLYVLCDLDFTLTFKKGKARAEIRVIMHLTK
jgi:hypothetical protein